MALAGYGFAQDRQVYLTLGTGNGDPNLSGAQGHSQPMPQLGEVSDLFGRR